MKLYLSSYRLGDYTDKLEELVGKPNAKVAVCVNALDSTPDEVRNGVVLKREIEDMQSLGFAPEELDLREYFGKPSIVEKLQQYDLIWLSGGNVFLLAKAFKQSGLGVFVVHQFNALERIIKHTKGCAVTGVDNLFSFD